MLIICYCLLLLKVGRCTDQIFETKTFSARENVALKCPCKSCGSLFWIRLVSGNLPEVMGKSFSRESVDPRIRTSEESGGVFLRITGAKLSDSGVYYCLQTRSDLTFLKGANLTVEGPEPDITAITQAPASAEVCPGDSETLQRLVLSDSENKTCPGDHPSVIYVPGNRSDECEKSHDTCAPQKCVCYFFKNNISSSGAGTYHCAVATCGEILFRNGTNVDIEDLAMWDLQKANTVVCLLCAALAISLSVISFLIYTVKKKSCGCSNATVVLETNAAAASGDHHSQPFAQRGEDSLIYSAPTFNKRKAGKQENRRNVKTAEGETVYSDIRAFVID